MLKSMKPGSVVVDLAIEAGGNVEGAEYDEVVTKHGVKIVAYANVPGRVAEDASKLFARNLLNFLTPMIDKESKTLKIDTEDETRTEEHTSELQSLMRISYAVSCL